MDKSSRANNLDREPPAAAKAGFRSSSEGRLRLREQPPTDAPNQQFLRPIARGRTARNATVLSIVNPRLAQFPEFHLVIPQFTKPIKGRPKTDRLDCNWIQRRHRHGLLPRVFRPDEPTQTLRDFVRQRANLVRLSGHHIQHVVNAFCRVALTVTT